MANRKSMSKTSEPENAVIVEPVKVVEEVVEEKAAPKKEKKVFDQNEGVMCHSVTQGGLFVNGPRTGMIYRFVDYDDVCEIEYRDLVALVRSKAKFIYHPYFIIDDEDFIAEYPALKKFYDEQYSIKDLRAVLRLPVPNMVTEIKRLPKGAVESLKTIAATDITNGRIDSISRVRALNEIFGTELEIADSLASL